MKEDDSLTVLQMARLSDWLKIRGMTAEDFDECLHYIANGVLPTEKGEKNQVPAATNDSET